MGSCAWAGKGGVVRVERWRSKVVPGWGPGWGNSGIWGELPGDQQSNTIEPEQDRMFLRSRN